MHRQSLSRWAGWLLVSSLLTASPATAQQLVRLQRQTGAGTITAQNGTVILPAARGIALGSLGVEASGTWTGTIQVECTASFEGTGAYVALEVIPRTGGSGVTSFTANGQWIGTIAGCQRVQARATAAMTGTAVITLTGDPVGGGGGGGGAATAVTNAGLTELAAAINANLVDVNIVSGAGSGGTAVADDADFTPGTTSFTPVGGFYQSTVTACTDGDTCAAGLTAQRTQKVTLYSAAGVEYTAAADPCVARKTVHVVNMSTATTVEIANAVASQFFFICSVNLIAQGAQTVTIGEDDTDGCGSITAGLHGGATAATGWSFPVAGDGIALGNGLGTVMQSSTANRYLCIITGQAVQLSGTILYVSAP